MKAQKTPVDRLWYKATLAPAAASLFTDSFYPAPKRGSGSQFVYFTQVDMTPTAQKVIVASKMEVTGLRMMTRDLALACLVPGAKATKAEMQTLNELSKNLKL